MNLRLWWALWEVLSFGFSMVLLDQWELVRGTCEDKSDKNETWNVSFDQTRKQVAKRSRTRNGGGGSLVAAEWERYLGRVVNWNSMSGKLMMLMEGGVGYFYYSMK